MSHSTHRRRTAVIAAAVALAMLIALPIASADDIDWTGNAGPLRTIFLNSDAFTVGGGANSLEILGNIGDASDNGLRFEAFDLGGSFDPNTEKASVKLGGQNTFSGELQVAVSVIVHIDDPTDSGDALDPNVVVRLETDGSNYGVLDLLDPIDIEVAEVYLGGVAQGPGTYNGTTDPNYFTGPGSLVVPLPEPATLVLLGLGGFPLLLKRRRKA